MVVEDAKEGRGPWGAFHSLCIDCGDGGLDTLSCLCDDEVSPDLKQTPVNEPATGLSLGRFMHKQLGIEIIDNYGCEEVSTI